jgi:prepilin-type N-terminal cleavage/methylation domain-containing protein
MDRRTHSKSAFTLIEIMAATAILLIIVLVMGAVFHQSSIAWDGGMRKAEGAMNARAALGFLARELSTAVVFPASDPGVLQGGNVQSVSGGGVISFFTLTHDSDADSNRRAVQLVTYEKVDDQLVRHAQECSGAGLNYGEYGKLAAVDPTKSVSIITNLSHMSFTSSGATGDRLPAWVNIKMIVNRSDDVSGVGAYSYGPDRQDGTEDDIRAF